MAAPDIHPEEHEDLLHALVSGDRDETDAEVHRRLATCETCRTRLSELRSVTGLLDEVLGEERRSLLAIERGSGTAPGADRVASTLRAEAAREAGAAILPGPRPGHSPGLAVRIGLAAASVMAAGWLVRLLLPPTESAPQDVTLSSQRAPRLLGPTGTVEAYGEFRWDFGISGDVRYRLRVLDAQASLTAAALVDLRGLTGTSWTPSQAELERLPQSIRWEVDVLDGTGGVIDSAATRAELSAR